MVFDLPLLGEPLPIELANTRYGDGDDRLDFLAELEAATTWLGAVGVDDAGSLTTDAHRDLLAVRDAVRRLVEARLDGTRPDAAALELVNHHAAGCPLVVQLDWLGDTPALTTAPLAADAVLGALAVAAIELVGGPLGDALGRCAAPDCTMLFVRHHGRRRFCHDGCSHRTRQARYVRRQRGTS